MNDTVSPCLSRHARIRANQRGIREGAISMIVALGKDMGRNRYDLDTDETSGWIAELKAERSVMMRGSRTKQRAIRIRELREMVRSLERALNMIVVICGNAIVTAYHGRKRRSRKSLGYL